MGMQTRYWCDMCEISPSINGLTLAQAKEELYGLRFTGNKTFEVTCPSKTDGKHICKNCLQQLVEQAP